MMDKTTVYQMLSQRRLALLHRYRIARFKLPRRSILKLEDEIHTRMARTEPGICGMIFGHLLVQTD